MTATTIDTHNPASGSLLKRYEVQSPAELENILTALAEHQRNWRERTVGQRAEVLRRAGEILLRDREKLAKLALEEMGKSRAEALAEVEKCASCARYYSERGPAHLTPIEVHTEATHSFVSFQPLGVVLAVMPWNFPYWQVFRCALPAILAGNTIALKHASNVTGCALAAEAVWREATGKEDTVFRTILLPGSQATSLISRPEIAAVSFTGSTSVGKIIARAAGENLKKCVLELGGSDPYVVLADADLVHAAKICAQSRLLNSGQSCISAKRFIVEAPVREKFEGKFAAALNQGLLPPLARRDLRDKLHEQVKKSMALGAKLVMGGEVPAGPGFYYPPTLLTGVKPGMPAFDEELFGPVAALIEAKDEAQALALANQTIYGLGAAVFTQDKTKGERIARERLEAGSCFVNELVRSDPRLPFGGIKESGFGRELSEFGLREFTNIKTVYVG